MIESKLKELSALRAEIEFIKGRQEEDLKAILGDKFDEFAKWQTESETEKSVHSDKIEVLEDEIKKSILESKKSAVGGSLEALWISGKVSWESASLEKFSKDHPAILKFKKVGNPYVQIRAKKATK